MYNRRLIIGLWWAELRSSSVSLDWCSASLNSRSYSSPYGRQFCSLLLKTTDVEIKSTDVKILVTSFGI